MSRPRSSVEINKMVDQTVSMIEQIQDNLQEPTTNAALVHHPNVIIKKESNADEVENSGDELQGSIENDPNRAFMEEKSEDENTPGNFYSQISLKLRILAYMNKKLVLFLVHYTVRHSPPVKKTRTQKLQEETADFLGEDFNPLGPRNKKKKDDN